VPQGSAAPSNDTDARQPRHEEGRMGYRIEKDFLGEKQVPDDAYYGVQTSEVWRTSISPASRCPGSRISSRPSAT
jgi:hypothetical protein